MISFKQWMDVPIIVKNLISVNVNFFHNQHMSTKMGTFSMGTLSIYQNDWCKYSSLSDCPSGQCFDFFVCKWDDNIRSCLTSTPKENKAICKYSGSGSRDSVISPKAYTKLKICQISPSILSWDFPSSRIIHVLVSDFELIVRPCTNNLVGWM